MKCLNVFRCLLPFRVLIILIKCLLFITFIYLLQNISWPTTRMYICNRNDEFRYYSNINKISSTSYFVDILKLANILGTKLNSIDQTIKVKQFKPTCDSAFKRANSCDNNKCLQTQLPENLTARVEQLVMPQKLQIPQEYRTILHDMTESIHGSYDIILLTAASSNHFLESQALLKNVHENVYPYLKNFTLIYYNLGLTEKERTLLVKYCRCQVIDFPFHKFPDFMKKLTCYSWKPVLVKSSLQKANVVFWIDASIRFNNSSTNLTQYIQRGRERGVQIGGSGEEATFRTSQMTYHFFGDESCSYLSLGEMQTGYGIYFREHFVDRVILEPWVACAISEECMCPKKGSILDCTHSNSMAAKYYKGEGPIVYGLCHRFDQSALGLILHKLYQEKYEWVINNPPVLSVHRGDNLIYFRE
jgi:hypothetical protein